MYSWFPRYAVHKALNNQDILWSILEFLNPYCPDHTLDSRDAPERMLRVKALSCIARTCQSFKDPALTLLWSELDNMRGIISLIDQKSQVRADVWDTSNQLLTLMSRYPIPQWEPWYTILPK